MRCHCYEWTRATFRAWFPKNSWFPAAIGLFHAQRFLPSSMPVLCTIQISREELCSLIIDAALSRYVPVLRVKADLFEWRKSLRYFCCRWKGKSFALMLCGIPGLPVSEILFFHLTLSLIFIIWFFHLYSSGAMIRPSSLFNGCLSSHVWATLVTKALERKWTESDMLFYKRW